MLVSVSATCTYIAVPYLFVYLCQSVFPVINCLFFSHSSWSTHQAYPPHIFLLSRSIICFPLPHFVTVVTYQRLFLVFQIKFFDGALGQPSSLSSAHLSSGSLYSRHKFSAQMQSSTATDISKSQKKNRTTMRTSQKYKYNPRLKRIF